jgi:YfdX protein
MKIRHLIITTILTNMIAFGAIAADDTITIDTMKTATSPVTKQEMSDQRVAAAGFVEHVNYARVALAMKNSTLAKQHITQARNMTKAIMEANANSRTIREVQSGRVVYRYDTDYKYHYFPIQTDLVQVKEMSNGPIWASSELAVSEANIVYLTLDLTGNKWSGHLDEAEKAIAANNLKSADMHLAQLVDEVVEVDSKIPMPNLKAHDNIALARNFIAGENYAGASYALKHADDALDEMQKNNNNKERMNEIEVMRKDVKELQTYIAQKDPTMIKKANDKMYKWWNELTTWSES